MEVKLRNICCYFAVVLVTLKPNCESKSVTAFNVPKSAGLGYTVTRLSSPGFISEDTDLWVRRLFTVLDDGALVLRSAVDHLGGQTVHLVIQHKDNHFLTRIHIRFTEDFERPSRFYDGYIYKDQPVGAIVDGLDDLYSFFDNAHQSRFFLRGKNDYFDLSTRSNGVLRLTTKISFADYAKERETLIIGVTSKADDPTYFVQVDVKVLTRIVQTPDNAVELALVRNTFEKLISINENTVNVVENDNSGVHLRMRRAVLADRTFVVRRQVTADLFTVKPDVADADAKFYFKDPAPEKLSINADSGMVSLKSGESWNATTTQVKFTVNVTTSTGESKDELPVLVRIVNRTQFDPIFQDERQPFPLYERVRQWTRPNTLVYTLHSIDKGMEAKVKYRLETGGDGRFGVNEDTGDVYTLGRLPFEVNKDYVLAVSARDIGAPRTETTITQTLTIRGGYRNPQFSEPNFYNITMKESTSVGTIVNRTWAKAFQEEPIGYVLKNEDGTASEEFSIDSSGDIRLQKSMDYAYNPHQYRLTVTATETASGFNTSTLVIINLEDENNHDPIFAPLVYTSNVLPETSPIGTTVVQVSASDLDAGENAELTYSVDNPAFTVETVNNAGIIKTKTTLDYDLQTENMYTFKVTATDKGQPARMGTATVRVPLRNSNDENPQFDPTNQTVYLNEEASANTLVHVVQAHDPDGDKITFSFTGGNNANGLFSINPSTGAITLKRKINAADKKVSQFILSITATDDNSCCGGVSNPRQGVGRVTVVLIGVNHPPTFNNCDQYNNIAEVEELKPSGTPVLNVTAEDEDSGRNGQLSYSLNIPYGETEYFTIDKGIGQLHTKSEFRRELPEGGYVYSRGATVNATDGGQPALSGVCYLQVKLKDVNDNAPFLDEAQYFTYITTSADRVIRVFAFDRDEGNNAKVIYSMTDAANCPNCFRIDSNTGVIRKQGNLSPGQTYVIKVKATDQGSPPKSTRDHDVSIHTVSSTSSLAPAWKNLDTVEDRVIEVLENVSRQYAVIELEADPQNGGSVVYSLPGSPSYMWELNGRGDFGKQESADGKKVSIVTLMNLDYEVINRYFLRVRASPTSDTNSKTYNDIRLQINIKDVNDRIPVFVGLDAQGKYSTTVTMDTEVGAKVLTIRANDLDGTSPNNLVSYRWKDNTTDYSAFNLSRDTGVITTARNFTGLRGKQYVLVVVAFDGAPAFDSTDGQPNSQEATVSIVISGPSDNPPYFSQPLYQYQEVAGAPHGKVVGTITAANANSIENLQYTFTSGNEEHLFAVDIQKGEITVAASFLPYNPNKQLYDLKYRVFDGRESNTTRVTIKVASSNLNPPVFSSNVYTATVPEDVEPIQGQKRLLANVSATDPDSSRVNQIQYTLAGNLNLNSFEIESTAVYLVRPLDRDYPNGHSPWMINVVAKDEPNSVVPKYGYAIISVAPTDRNDHAPVFDTCCLTGSVPEKSVIGTTVMTVIASDVDDGVNAEIRYELLNTPDSSSFQINAGTGEIKTTVDSLDRETKDSYHVTIKASDNGNPPLSTNQQILIQISDQNDNAPGFTQKQYMFYMPENLPIGGSVGSVYANDLDIGLNAVRIYTIDGAVPQFYVDSIFSEGSGVVKANQLIDYERDARQYKFTVKVKNEGLTGSDDSTEVTVIVTDVNDNAPVVQPQTQTSTVAENVSVGTTLATFNATDADSGTNAQFSFAIDYKNSDTGKHFAIGADDGIVTTIKTLDREKIPVHVVKILAIDKGEPAMTGTGTLSVVLNDINDSPPEFAQDYKPVVQPDAPIGTTVVTLRARDADTPAASGKPFTFSKGACVNGNDACTAFELDSNSAGNGGLGEGIVRTLISNFKRDETPYYFLPVIIKDNGSPQQTGTSTLTIAIADTNDNSPKPGHKEVVVYNYNLEFPDVSIGYAYAEDPDDWDRADKTFSWVGSPPSFFTLNPADGEIIMKTRTPDQTYDLQVRVQDKQGPPVIATVKVNVIGIYDDAVQSSGSLQLTGTTAEDFIKRPKSGSGPIDYGKSPMDKLISTMATTLNTAEANVHVFAVMNHPEKPNTVNVRVAAHGSPWYKSSRLDGLMLQNKAKIESDIGVTIGSVPINECLQETCLENGCSNTLVVNNDPVVVTTNSTTVVGVNARVVASCECAAKKFPFTPKCSVDTCFNNGTCSETPYGYYKCTCPPGFDGPRCQQTHHSFSGSGWAWYDTLTQCYESKLSLQFMTKQENGLILYNGPMTNTDASDVADFLAIELLGGYPRVKVDLGSGEGQLLVQGGSKLNDGNWHTLELFQNGKTYRLVVDYCKSSDISENITVSEDDRSKCQAQVTLPGENIFLNVYTPLELGGRSKPNVNYPGGITSTGFNGCIKNLYHNGILYDLNIGQTGEQSGSEDGCPAEEVNCGLNDVSGPKCKGNSTCIGSLNSNTNPTCLCKPGYQGDSCDYETPATDFRDASFVEWSLNPTFASSLSNREGELQVMFRTRRANGLLFSAASENKMEHLKLELVNYRLQFRYDLGSNDILLTLPDVTVSNGSWHIVRISRYGNQIIMRLDGGEGRYYAESSYSNLHREITLWSKETFAGADVTFTEFSRKRKIVTGTDYVDSCMNDVRMNNRWFHMSKSLNADSNAAVVEYEQNLRSGCQSDVCSTTTCPRLQNCTDLWRYPVCQCPRGWRPDPVEGCYAVGDCSAEPCVNGLCVNKNGSYVCNCYRGWIGLTCNLEPGAVVQPQVTLSNGGIAAVVVSLLLLLLLLLIVCFVSKKKNPETVYLVDPNDDIRENVFNYNEEGAGEEDQHGYDISRLRKPVEPFDDSGSLHKPPLEDMPRTRAAPLTGQSVPDAPPANIEDFINNRKDDADRDPNAPPFDSVREYEYEGSGSKAGSLSSLQSSSSGDQDYDYLNDWGPRFAKLADMYGAGRDEDED